ncbi:hypothetical protein DMUE_2776, partial [Dictyocoela muelleri]
MIQINLQFIDNLNNNIDIITFLRSFGVLREYIYCDECNNLLHQVKYKRNKDGYAFKCNRSTCSKYQVYISIRKNSFFNDFKLDLKILLKIIYSWFKDENQVQVCRDYNVS